VQKTLVKYFGEVKQAGTPDSPTVGLYLEIYRKKWKENTANPRQKELLSESGPQAAPEKTFTVFYRVGRSPQPVATRQFTTARNGMMTVDFPSEVRLYLKSEDDRVVEFKDGYPQVSAETLAIWLFKQS
jgi:hypothetical protein